MSMSVFPYFTFLRYCYDESKLPIHIEVLFVSFVSDNNVGAIIWISSVV